MCQRFWILACGVLLLAGLVGCDATDPKTLELRNRLVLTEEPAGAMSIAESREKLAANPEVVVVGRIQSGEVDPWAKGQAAFMLSEDLGDAHAKTSGHDPANCPFCRRRAEKGNTTALVQFRDETGKPLAIDARELLGVGDNQVVVVRGKGEVNDLGLLVIAADSIHLRK